jgi:hypothetical protein
MFWKKKNKNKTNVGPEIIEKFSIGNMEITRVKTSKPIKAAKPGIRIDNMTIKPKSFLKFFKL